ncbi:MAG: MFS transporter [Rickettsiales bacterium]|nr:MAG: MFS transporter [Rickettsiales bacterium]
MTMAERKIYNKWRLRILISIILGYGTYYLCRLNFSIIMPAYIEEFSYSKTQLGWVITITSIVYGVGKFVNGYFSDKSNARYFMPAGLILSAIITFILGFTNSLVFLGIFLIFNYWFQSMGWPPAARMLTHWFAPQELGTKWALGAASHQIGGALTLIFCGYLVANFGWRYAFFIPGIIAFIVGVILFSALRDSPKELGLPPVEAYKGDEDFKEDTSENHLGSMEIFLKVFANRNIWYICFANMCVYFIRSGIVVWAPLFLIEFKDFSLVDSGWQVAAYEFAGLPGGFMAGWISDKLFGGKRGFVGIMFMSLLALALYTFWKLPAEHIYLSASSLACIGFFLSGPQILVGLASADFASKKAVGTANGWVGTVGQLGASLSGIGVGLLTQYYGWDAAFMAFIGAAILGAVFFSLTLKNRA